MPCAPRSGHKVNPPRLPGDRNEQQEHTMETEKTKEYDYRRGSVMTKKTRRPNMPAKRTRRKDLELESYITRSASFEFLVSMKHLPSQEWLAARHKDGIDIQVVVAETNDGALECEL